MFRARPLPRGPAARVCARALGKRRTLLIAAAVPLTVAALDGAHAGSLPAPPGPRGPRTAEQAAIEEQPVCIGSTVASAGRLADVLYYRAVALDDGHVAVGYYAFFSEERPWGDNWLTWSVLPALGVDLVYSRTLLVAPGLQRVLYGAGDVEGVGVVYERRPDGALRLDHALAEDDGERPVVLSRADALALDPGRPTFYADLWSHQLGSTRARSRKDLAYAHCYSGDSIRPLPDELAREFRVDVDRAPPAHVERLGGRRLDDVTPPPDRLAERASAAAH